MFGILLELCRISGSNMALVTCLVVSLGTAIVSGYFLVRSPAPEDTSTAIATATNRMFVCGAGEIALTSFACKQHLLGLNSGQDVVLNSEGGAVSEVNGEYTLVGTTADGSPAYKKNNTRFHVLHMANEASGKNRSARTDRMTVEAVKLLPVMRVRIVCTE
jgi:hypothetical protein